MTSGGMETEAREAAEQKVDQCFAGGDILTLRRACKAAYYAYLAAAEPRERELERLRAEVAKVTEQRDAWPKYHGMATEGLMVLHDRRDLQDLSGLRCGDFMANAVPHLVAEIDRLRARVAELEGLAEANNRGIPVRHA